MNGFYIAGFVTFALVCVFDETGPQDTLQGVFGFGMAVCLWAMGAAQNEVRQLRKERSELRQRIEREVSPSASQ